MAGASTALGKLLKQGSIFLPFVFRLAARMEQMSWQEFTSEPLVTAAALRTAQAASRAGGVVNWFDTCSEIESLGVKVDRDAFGRPPLGLPSLPTPCEPSLLLDSPLFSQLTETAARLCQERVAGTLVAGFITGFKTLARRLGYPEGENNEGAIVRSAHERTGAAAELASRWILKLMRAYCESGVDLIVMAEEEPGVGSFYYAHSKLLQPVFNLSKYYLRPVMVLLREPQAEMQLSDSVLGYSSLPTRTLTFPSDIAGPGQLCVVRNELIMSPGQEWSNELAAELNCGRGQQRLHISSWEVPPEVEPERLIEICRRIEDG
jgi:hypothetical protein